MKTKLEAAKISLNSGASTWVASGLNEDTLLKIFRQEEVGTRLITDKSILQSRKLWISSFGSSAGDIVLDEGACNALLSQGKSLLSVGVLEVIGTFDRGDLIRCLDADGAEIGKGLSNFNSKELGVIKGINSKEIEQALGYLTEEEVIHRNNLVLS